MPRPWTLTPEAYPPLPTDTPCPVLATGVRKAKGDIIEVTLAHLDPAHDGRTTLLHLPQAVLPNNLTAQFFRACGMTIATGTPLQPRDAEGKTLHVVFGDTSSTAHPVPTQFHPIEPEPRDAK